MTNNTLVPQRFTPFFMFIFLFLFLLSSSPVTVSGETCNPEDLKALLAIKASFNNATFFDSWNPNTNCCSTWTCVSCDSGRVTSLCVSYDQTLTGTIPDAIGDLQFLKRISFGVLPGLVGPLPNALCKLHHLEYIQFTTTSLSGEIPECIGNLKNLSVFITENNYFSGKIPENVGNSPKLRSLALMNNDPGLTGCIPKSLFKNVEPNTRVALDLSHNRLSGEIPDQISQLLGLDDLNLSYNQLCGKIPTGGPMSRFNLGSYGQNKCLCGEPLPPCT